MKQNDIKNALNEIKPDAHIKTRLEAKVSEKTKPKTHRRTFTAGIAAVLCIVIVAVSVGISGITIKTNPISPATTLEPTQTDTAISKAAPGFVLFAYAGTNDKVEISELNISSPFISKIGIKDVRGMTEEQIEKEVKKIREKFNFISREYENETITYQTLTHSERFDNTIIYSIYCGYYDFDLPEDTYDAVKEIRVTNDNRKFGQMEIGARDCFYNDDLSRKDNGVDYTKSAYITNYELEWATLSGDRFRKCMKLSEDNGKMFSVNWKLSNEAYDILNDNPDYDLSTINDTLTFEVEFNDGSVSRSIIDISFDSDGNMHIAPQTYDYIK